MQNETCGMSTHAHHHFKCISWSAIFAGAFVGIGVGFLLNLLAMALGLSWAAIGKAGMASLATGGFLGIAISTIVSMFFAGMTAGCFARTHNAKRCTGITYGFVTWTLVLFLSVFFAAHVGNAVAQYTGFFTNQATISVAQDQATPALAASMQPNDTTVVMVNAQKATHALSYTSAVVFILFALGALASCFGGICGVRCGTSCCGTSCCKCGPSCKCDPSCHCKKECS